MTSNLHGANAGVWVNTTVDSTKGKWSGTVVHNPWGAKEQPQDQEGIGQSKMEQEPRAEEEDLLKVEQVLRELGAWEQPQNQEGIGQSHVKRAEPEGATEATSPGKIVLESAGLAWMETAEIESEDSTTEEAFSSQSLLEFGDMSQAEMGNDIGFDEGLAEGQSWGKESRISLRDRAVLRRPMTIYGKPATNTGAQSKENPSKGLVQCFWCNWYGHTAVKCRKKTNPRWAEIKDALADKAQKAASAIQVLVLDEEIQAWNDKVPVMEIDIEGQKAMALKDLAGLTARPSKCVIGTKTRQFLGHHVGAGARSRQLGES